MLWIKPQETRILAYCWEIQHKQENVLIPLLLVTMEQLPLSIKISSEWSLIFQITADPKMLVKTSPLWLSCRPDRTIRFQDLIKAGHTVYAAVSPTELTSLSSLKRLTIPTVQSNPRDFAVTVGWRDNRYTTGPIRELIETANHLLVSAMLPAELNSQRKIAGSRLVLKASPCQWLSAQRK